MFWTKIKKTLYIYSPVSLHKSGVDGGIHFTDLFPDGAISIQNAISQAQKYTCTTSLVFDCE